MYVYDIKLFKNYDFLGCKYILRLIVKAFYKLAISNLNLLIGFVR
jgi:hypothetical protein